MHPRFLSEDDLQPMPWHHHGSPSLCITSGRNILWLHLLSPPHPGSVASTAFRVKLEKGGRKAMKEDPLLHATSLSIWHLSFYKEKSRVYSRLISVLSIWAKRSLSRRGSPPPTPMPQLQNFAPWKVAANVWRHGSQDPHTIILHIKFQRAYFPCLNTQDTHLFNSFHFRNKDV